MDPENQHPSFDSEEQAILSEIKPDDASMPADGVTGDAGDQPLPTDAPVVETPSAAPTPAAETPAATTPVVEQPAAAVETPPAEQPKPQGDTRAALRAARHAEKRLRDENERLKQELEAARTGQAPVDSRLTDEELEQLEQDFPLQAKLARRQRELEEQIAATRTATPPAAADFEPPSYPPQVQEVIDEVPDLLTWQHDPASQDKFQRAVEYDKALLLDPDWKGRTPAERFAEAAERTKRAFAAAPAAAPSPSAAPAATRLDPAAALAAAPASGPKGISDFRGGAPASSTELDYSAMSDEAVMASLAPS